MVKRRPDADLEARLRHRLRNAIRKTGLEADEAADGMGARTVHGIGAQAFVEEAGDDLHERAAKAFPPAAPTATARPSASVPIVGDIMLAIPLARGELADEEVGLAEHAVQMQVEAREPVARAQAEGSSSRTTAFPSRSTTLRFVVSPFESRPCGGEGDRDRVGARQALQHGQRAVQGASTLEGDSPVPGAHGLRPPGRVGVKVLLGHEAAALVHQLQERSVQRGPGSSSATSSSARTRPGCSRSFAGREQPSLRRVDPLAFAHRHHRREHLEAGGVGGSIATPAPACSAGSTPSPGETSVPRQSASRPGGPRHAHEPTPTA